MQTANTRMTLSVPLRWCLLVDRVQAFVDEMIELCLTVEKYVIPSFLHSLIPSFPHFLISSFPHFLILNIQYFDILF